MSEYLEYAKNMINVLEQLLVEKDNRSVPTTDALNSPAIAAQAYALIAIAEALEKIASNGIVVYQSKDGRGT